MFGPIFGPFKLTMIKTTPTATSASDIAHHSHRRERSLRCCNNMTRSLLPHPGLPHSAFALSSQRMLRIHQKGSLFTCVQGPVNRFTKLRVQLHQPLTGTKLDTTSKKERPGDESRAAPLRVSTLRESTSEIKHWTTRGGVAEPSTIYPRDRRGTRDHRASSIERLRSLAPCHQHRLQHPAS
jgi:hypothetical protein